MLLATAVALNALKSKVSNVSVVDNSGFIFDKLESTESIKYIQLEDFDLEEAKLISKTKSDFGLLFIEILESTKEQMQGAINFLIKELRIIRAGKASPAMLSTIVVDYYGSLTPLNQVANVNTPDARTISIQPWEKQMLPLIEKAIMVANIGFNPMNNGENIIINVPPLTEERRRDLAKQAKVEAEHAKVGIRNARKEANNEIKKLDLSDDMKKNTETDVQELTNAFVKKAEELFDTKEKEIMTI